MAFHPSETDSDNVAKQVQNPVPPRLNSKIAKGIQNFVTPTENAADTQVLMFRHATKAQERTRRQQQPRKLEPLVSSETNILATFGYRGSCKIAFGEMEYF